MALTFFWSTDETDVKTIATAGTNINITAVYRPLRKPVTRHKIEVPQRKYLWDFGGGVTRDYTVSVVLAITGETSAQVMECAGALEAFLDGKNHLIFSDSPNESHYGQVFVESTLFPEGKGNIARAALEFECEHYRFASEHVTIPPAEATAEGTAPTVYLTRNISVTIPAAAATASGISLFMTVSSITDRGEIIIGDITDAGKRMLNGITDDAQRRLYGFSGVVASTYITPVTITARAAAATAAGIAPSITTAENISIESPTATATAEGVIPSIQIVATVDITAPTADADAGAVMPEVSVTTIATITAPTGTATAEGIAPTVDISGRVSVLAPTATATAEGISPVITVSAEIHAPPATATAEGIAPVIVVAEEGFVITDRGEIVVNGITDTGKLLVNGITDDAQIGRV